MELYDELKEAISECMNNSEESPEFKRRFSSVSGIIKYSKNGQ